MRGEHKLSNAETPPPLGSWEASAQMRRIMDLVRDFSIETVPIDLTGIEPLRDRLRRGAPVYIVSPPGRRHNEIIDTARDLHRAGFQPVPHIAARSMADRDDLADFLRQVTSEAGVRQVLVVGGTRGKPLGEFHCSQQILETGLLEEFGIRRVGLAGHPEGHPDVDRKDITRALLQKITYARRIGMDVHVVSQFCFDPHAVVTWVEEIRELVHDVPVRIGTPGPAALTSLVKYARMCGVGDSVKFLTRGASSVLKLVTWAPDNFLTALAHYKSANPDCGIAGVHFYSFGGTAKTARWLAGVGGGEFTMRRDGRGFEVNENGTPHD